MDLTVNFCGIPLKNPVMIGSNDFSRSILQFRKAVESGAGAIAIKSLGDAEALHNPYVAKFLCLNPEQESWKAGQQVGGFYSRGGCLLRESEWKKLAAEELRIAEDNNVLLIGNLNVSSMENWSRIARTMEDVGIKAIEVNLANPHYPAAAGPMGAKISQSDQMLTEVVETVAHAVSVPLFVKLGSQVGDIVQVARAAKKAGAAAVIVCGRFQGLIIDIKQQEPLCKSLFGWGGRWMLPIAVGYVTRVAREVQIPICGSSGIFTSSDILQYMMAGATTVQLTTALYLHGPQIVQEILRGMKEFCEQNGIARLEEVIGSALGKEGYYDRMPETARVRVKDKSVCLQCDLKPCIDSCCFDAIQESKDGGVEIITENCTACGLCLQICPFTDALSLEEK